MSATSTTFLLGLLCIVTTRLPLVTAQRSIVFVHGVISNASTFDTMQPWIQKDFPNASTYSLTAYSDKTSLVPIWEQLQGFADQLQPIMDRSPDGVKLICYSQGGVVCRGLLSTLQHNVDTLITLSSPLAGQYGDEIIATRIENRTQAFFYTEVGQDVSVGNYWNDPHHHQLYLKENQFLPVLNNETYNPKNTEFKENFSRLKHLVMVGGPQDEVIGPWQSSQLQFYDRDEVVQPMKNQSWYINDAFGLRTLDEEGRIHTCTVPDIIHHQWPRTLSVYQQCVKPWLGQ